MELSGILTVQALCVFSCSPMGDYQNIWLTGEHSEPIGTIRTLAYKSTQKSPPPCRRFFKLLPPQSLRGSSALARLRSPPLLGSRELKRQRRRRVRKRHSKSEFALLQTLSHLLHLVQFVKCWHFFWNWILKDCGIEVQEKERRSRAVTAKHCTKKAWCTCKVVFVPI